jgi:hypothetical protein
LVLLTFIDTNFNNKKREKEKFCLQKKNLFQGHFIINIFGENILKN